MSQLTFTNQDCDIWLLTSGLWHVTFDIWHKVTFCHWNLTGLAAHDFMKVPLVKAFIASKSFDIVCLFETFLDPTISTDDENVQIKGKSWPSKWYQMWKCLYLFYRIITFNQKKRFNECKGLPCNWDQCK